MNESEQRKAEDGHGAHDANRNANGEHGDHDRHAEHGGPRNHEGRDHDEHGSHDHGQHHCRYGQRLPPAFLVVVGIDRARLGAVTHAS